MFFGLIKLMPHARAAHLRIGAKGEKIARRLFESEGAQLMAQDWRCPAGELDLVMLLGLTLIFVEVKTIRKQARFSPLDNLSWHQRMRNYRAAKYFLKVKEAQGFSARFCLVEVTLSKRGWLLDVRRTYDYLPEIPARI